MALENPYNLKTPVQPKPARVTNSAKLGSLYAASQENIFFPSVQCSIIAIVWCASGGPAPQPILCTQAAYKEMKWVSDNDPTHDQLILWHHCPTISHRLMTMMVFFLLLFKCPSPTVRVFCPLSLQAFIKLALIIRTNDINHKIVTAPDSIFRHETGKWVLIIWMLHATVTQVKHLSMHVEYN